MSTPAPNDKKDDDKPETVLHNGRYIINKKANKPFMKKSRWDADDIARFDAAKKKKKETDTNNGPSVYLGLFGRSAFGLAKWMVLGAVVSLLLSIMITESWTWGYRGKWTNLRTYFPPPQKQFTPEQLSNFAGEVSLEEPIYLAIKGDVFDVSTNRRTYGPGGPYHHFAGRDASRAYVTGCFKTHLTPDVRGLTDKELRSIDRWHSFFKNHADYYKVGTVLHPEISPDSPIPEDCNAKAEGGAR